MTTLNELVMKAYDAYGSTLGIKSVQLPLVQGGNRFVTVRDFHFFLKDEPLPSRMWTERNEAMKAGKVQHAIPFKGGIYSYTNGNQYETLDHWYKSAATYIYGDSLPPMETVLLYGRRNSNGLAYELTYGEMVQKLNELLSVNIYQKEADSWDTLAKVFPHGVGRKGLKLYYKDPELNYIVKTAVMKNAVYVVGWTPDKPRYVVPARSKQADGNQHAFRLTATVSEIHPHLLLEDVYLEGTKKLEGCLFPTTVLIPLAELLAQNAS
jgi:hypothetical protein